jgi:plasmid stabilization system protein ParE
MEADEKVYEVEVDPAANDRMAEHIEFLARVSESAADRLVDELLADICSLRKTPYRNPIYTRPYVTPGKYRYMISAKRYRIVYQIDGKFVFVDDIQDCRQDDDKSIIKP